IDVAVRHTPLTATLSPSPSAADSDDSIVRRAPPLVSWRSVTSPTASTRPVNITFRHHIWSQRLDVRLYQLRQRKMAAIQKLDAVRSQRLGCCVHPHVVNNVFKPPRFVHRGTAFKQQ